MRRSPPAFIDRIFGRAASAGRPIALGMTVLLVALWAAIAAHIENDRSLTRAGIQRDTGSMAKLVEEHALAALRQIDEFSYRLKFFYERNGADWKWFDVV